MFLTATDLQQRQLEATVNSDIEVQSILKEIDCISPTETSYTYPSPMASSTIKLLEDLGYSITPTAKKDGYVISWPKVDYISGQFSRQTKEHITTRKRIRLNTVLCIIIILLLLFLNVGYFTRFQERQVGLIALIDVPNQAFEIPDWDPDVITIPEDENIPSLNKKLEMDEMCINMRGAITLADTYSTGIFNIINDDGNNYPQFVTITLDGNGMEIYKSGLIPVGKCILYAKLDMEVPAGEHKCTAMFTQVNPETNKICGQAAAKITLTIKE